MHDSEQYTDEGLLHLLDEYMTACEGGEVIDSAPYELRAGSGAAELRRQIGLLDGLRGISSMLQGPSPEEQQFGRFVTQEVLGTGGSSRVYRAFDPQLGRDIALKVLESKGAGVDHASLREARALAKLDHPCVVKVYEVGECDGQATIAMEYVEGVDLRAVIRALRVQVGDEPESWPGESTDAMTVAAELASTASRCRLIARLSRALAYCHREGIVHRDVKPENVLICEGLRPKLIDFGLARSEAKESLLVTSTLRGTPAYLAPEQVDKEASGADPASDQFSLGSVLYELLTLDHPFRCETLNATLSAISEAAPVPPRVRQPELPLDAGLICAKAIEREPSRRYPNMSALAEDLEAFLDHRAVSVRPASALRQLSMGLKRRRRQVGLALATFALASGVWGLTWWGVVERERGAFTASLDEGHRQLSADQTPAGLGEIFRTIGHAWPDAQRHDQSLLGRLHKGTMREEVDALWSVASRKLQAAMQSPERRIEPSKREAEYLAFRLNWTKVAALAELSGPPDGSDFEFPELGSVELPEGGSLERYAEAVPAWPLLVSQPRATSKVPAGFYRYSRVIDGDLQETEFLVSEMDPRWAPPVRPLVPGISQGMTDVQGGVLVDPETGEDHTLDAFRITSKFVTWGAVRAHFNPGEISAIEDRARALELFPLGQEDPAVLPWVYAQEFCARVGARIPTPLELSAAALQGLTPDTEGIQREWTSTVVVKEEHERCVWMAPTEGDGLAVTEMESLKEYHDEAMVMATGFRLAISACP